MTGLRSLLRAVREIRWRSKGWTSERDRVFHDELFAGAAYNPFTFAYPGYLTIRRFAELASASITDDVRQAIDVGCGPGEITCEWARRYPAVAFVGTDHSDAAIQRANEHARRLGLPNVRFLRLEADAIDFSGMGLVLMFDAFHHLPEPHAFVRRARAHCSRFFFIEPAGAWHGGWRRQIEFDWLLSDVDTIRARIDDLLGDTLTAAPAPVNRKPAPPAAGEAVERRYTLDDFAELFSGLRIAVRGTVAGFDAYPPNPYATGGNREWMGELTYEALCRIEQRLIEVDRDLAAKHWAISVSPDPPIPLRRVPTVDVTSERSSLQGPYDVVLGPTTPDRLEGRIGQTALVRLRITNRSWREWRSDGPTPILLSYHWCTTAMAVLEEGDRTALPRPLQPGDSVDVTLPVVLPTVAGEYVLAIEPVHEGVCWFTAAGASPRTVPCRVG